MKKMWKLNNKAVSPVIATILMVAITVVLAAVLYVMVMGFGGSDTSDAPTVTLAKTTSGGDLQVVISLDRQVNIENLGIAINGVVQDGNIDTYANTTAFAYRFTPINAGKVSTSDRLVIDNVTAGMTLQLVWMPSGADGGDKELVGTVITF